MALVCGTLILAVLGCFVRPASGVQTEHGSRMQGKTEYGTRIQGKAGLQVNPVRRVVTMMQDLKKKIEDEGVAAEKLWDEVYCQCKETRTKLTSAIDLGEKTKGWLETQIAVKSAEKQQLAITNKKQRVEREEAMQIIAEEKTIRGKDKKTFDKEYADTKMNLDALKSAVKSLEAGMGGSFLQTKSAHLVKELSMSMDLPDEDRDQLASFLTAGSGQTYTPQSGEILGILKQMADTTAKEYKQMRDDEIEAERKHRELVASKESQITLLSDSIQRSNVRMAELGVQIVSHKLELKEVDASLMTNRKLLSATTTSCLQKEMQHEENEKTRGQELKAIAEAIGILNNDESLELFKKAMSSPSLMQLQMNEKTVKKQALAALHGSGSDDIRLNFISLALKGRKVDFSKVLKSIDSMVRSLVKQQRADDKKKDECEANLEEIDDKLKGNQRKHELAERNLQEIKEGMDAVAEKLKEMMEQKDELAEMLEEQKRLRKEDKELFEKAMLLDVKAREKIQEAKNVLQGFYNSDGTKNAKLKKLPSEVQLSDDIHDMPSFVQVASQSSYKPATAESSGVFALLDTYLLDLNKEIKEQTDAENEAEKDYENLVAESGEKQAEMDKTLNTYLQEGASLHNQKYNVKQDKKDASRGIIIQTDELKDEHASCDWLLLNYEVRMKARRGEQESLKSAKAVINGADFEFLQIQETDARQHLRR